jgi:hypothetical protein
MPETGWTSGDDGGPEDYFDADRLRKVCELGVQMCDVKQDFEQLVARARAAGMSEDEIDSARNVAHVLTGIELEGP